MTPQGYILTLRHVWWFGISVQNMSNSIYKYPKYSNIRIFENSLAVASEWLFVNESPTPNSKRCQTDMRQSKWCYTYISTNTII